MWTLGVLIATRYVLYTALFSGQEKKDLSTNKVTIMCRQIDLYNPLLKILAKDLSLIISYYFQFKFKIIGLELLWFYIYTSSLSCWNSFIIVSEVHCYSIFTLRKIIKKAAETSLQFPLLQDMSQKDVLSNCCTSKSLEVIPLCEIMCTWHTLESIRLLLLLILEI